MRPTWWRTGYAGARWTPSSPWPAGARCAATPTDRSRRRSSSASSRRAASSGSSQNRQPWRFVVVASPEARERTAEAVWAGDNVRGAALVIAVIVGGKGPVSFDAGRAAQNMLLAAWNEGVGACPNGIADKDAMADAIGLREADHFATVLTFGYPARDIDPGARTPKEWIARADRRPLDELVERR